MARWIDDVQKALENLGGSAHLSEIYDEVRKLRNEPHPKSFTAIIRRELEVHSSDSHSFTGGDDLFYSVQGLGTGEWGLRSIIAENPKPVDFGEQEEKSPSRVLEETYRILRDSLLAKKIKQSHSHECQICGSFIVLPNGQRYSEAHHIKPLGKPHNGPDVPENIIVVCPNHHVMLDYGVMTIDSIKNKSKSHNIASNYIEYHNQKIYGKTNFF